MNDLLKKFEDLDIYDETQLIHLFNYFSKTQLEDFYNFLINELA